MRNGPSWARERERDSSSCLAAKEVFSTGKINITRDRTVVGQTNNMNFINFSIDPSVNCYRFSAVLFPPYLREICMKFAMLQAIIGHCALGLSFIWLAENWNGRRETGRHKRGEVWKFIGLHPGHRATRTWHLMREDVSVKLF